MIDARPHPNPLPLGEGGGCGDFQMLDSASDQSRRGFFLGRRERFSFSSGEKAGMRADVYTNQLSFVPLSTPILFHRKQRRTGFPAEESRRQTRRQGPLATDPGHSAVRRGQDGVVAWRGEIRPSRAPVARLGDALCAVRVAPVWRWRRKERGRWTNGKQGNSACYEPAAPLGGPEGSSRNLGAAWKQPQRTRRGGATTQTDQPRISG